MDMRLRLFHIKNLEKKVRKPIPNKSNKNKIAPQKEKEK
jgi:hypothetical protein